MTPTHSDARSSRQPIIDWLLDSDPSIRWQVMRDLTETPADIVAAERSRVAAEGWGARLLDQQRPDGQWGDGVTTPFWWSNMYTLVFLRDLGIDPANERVQGAIDLVRRNVTWGPWHENSPFFEGEVEPCINGRVVALGAYFGGRSDRLVDRLLSEQLADGGWNCQAPPSVHSSFHTTICVLEGLLAFEHAFGATTPVTDARGRGQEYLLERRLLRRLSTGEIINPAWTRFAFPTLWGNGRRRRRAESMDHAARAPRVARLIPQTQQRTPAHSCGRSVFETLAPSYGLKLGLLRVSTSGSGTHVRSLYVFPLRVTPFTNGRLYLSMSPYRCPSLNN